MELTEHIAFCVIVDTPVPESGRIKEIVELTNAALHDLHHIVRAGTKPAHVIAIDNENPAILSGPDQFVWMRRRIVGQDYGRTATQICIVLREERSIGRDKVVQDGEAWREFQEGIAETAADGAVSVHPRFDEQVTG